MAKRDKNGLKNLAQLTGFDSSGLAVHEQTMSLDEYYEGLHEIIDQDQRRRGLGIVRIVGKLYDQRGALVQEFENEYADDGSYLRSTARYADGAVVEG